METLEQYMARREMVRAELTGADDVGNSATLLEDALGISQIAAPRSSMLLSANCLSRRQAE